MYAEHCDRTCIIIIMLFVSAVFSGAELENAFRHVFDLVWSQDPESFPFRQPVDPKLLGIPVRHLTSSLIHALYHPLPSFFAGLL